jgi:hypothetical protein
MKIFEYAVMYVPSNPSQKPEGRKTPQLVLPPVAVLARDDAHARTLAARAIPKDWEDVIDEMQVAIRPF